MRNESARCRGRRQRIDICRFKTGSKEQIMFDQWIANFTTLILDVSGE